MSFLYSFLRPFAACLQHTLIPTKYDHAERLKGLEPPYILIANHQSLLDPVPVAYPVKKYEVSFLGKKEINSNRLVKWFVTTLHMIPVDRGNTDMEAMRACMKVLRGGGILGIFPEGTRNRGGLMEHIESGVSLIALRGGAPLIPMYIEGKYAPFHRVRVHVGEPIPMDDLRADGVNSETAARLNERITETYRRLAEEAAKGKA